MSGNIIKKFHRQTSRPSSACDEFQEQSENLKFSDVKSVSKGNNIRLFQVRKKTVVGDVSKYPICHHHGNFILDRNGLSRNDHMKILSKPKIFKPCSKLKKKRYRYSRSNFQLCQLAKPNLKKLRQTFEQHKHQLNMIQVEKFVKNLLQPAATPTELTMHFNCERRCKKNNMKTCKVKKAEALVKKVLKVLKIYVDEFGTFDLIECFKKQSKSSSVASYLSSRLSKDFPEKPENLNENETKLRETLILLQNLDIISPEKPSKVPENLPNTFEILSDLPSNFSENILSLAFNQDIDSSVIKDQIVKLANPSEEAIKINQIEKISKSVEISKLSKLETSDVKSNSSNSSSGSESYGKIEGLKEASFRSEHEITKQDSLLSLPERTTNTDQPNHDSDSSSHDELKSPNSSKNDFEDSSILTSRQISDDELSEESITFDHNRPSSTPSRLRFSPSERGPSAITLHRRDFLFASSTSFLRIPEANISEYRFPDSEVQLPIHNSEIIETEVINQQEVEEALIVETFVNHLENEVSVVDISINQTNDTELGNQITTDDSKLEEVLQMTETDDDSNLKYEAKVSLIALREYTNADKNYNSSVEELVHVTKSNFNKVYVVRKLQNQKDIEEFCRDPISRRSKLFKRGSRKNHGPVEVERLALSELKKICNQNHQTVLKEATAVVNFDISQENFTVQKVEKVTRTRLETTFPAVDIKVAKNSKDATQFNVTKYSETE